MGRALLMMWLIALILLVQACGREEHEAKSERRAEGPTAGSGGPENQGQEGSVLRIPADRVKALGIRVEAVRRGAVPQTITTTAFIEPNANRIVNVTPRLPGKAVQVLVDLGDAVKQGQRLALLDSVELREARAQYVKSKVSMDAARVEYERQQRLYEKGIAAQRNLLDAQREYRVAKAEFEAAQEKLRLYGLSPREIEAIAQGHAETNASFPVLAPFAGTIVDKRVSLGEVVAPEKSLFTIADLSTVWILLDIYEKDLAKVQVGDEVNLSVAAYPDQHFAGKITYISDLMDEKTRTAKARVEARNPDRKLKPGMFAEAKIVTQQGTKTALLVPKSAVVYLEEGPVVFVEAEGGFVARKVTLSEAGEEILAITEGLSGGERVVTRGAYELKAELLKGQIGED
jgi:membrane fusion protein, heavy metal efflux system